MIQDEIADCESCDRKISRAFIRCAFCQRTYELQGQLSASRRESAALGAMVARLKAAGDETAAALNWAIGGPDAHGPMVARGRSAIEAFDAAVALTPATVGAEYKALVELEHAIGEVRRHWGSAVGATDGQRAVIAAIAKLNAARALLSDRAPGKENDNG